MFDVFNLTSNTKDNLVQHAFEDAVANHYDLPALVFENDIIIDGQLNDRADRIARIILHKLPDQDIIDVSTTRSYEMMIAALAVLKARKTYPPVDPAYQEAGIIDDFRCLFNLLNITNRPIHE